MASSSTGPGRTAVPGLSESGSLERRGTGPRDCPCFVDPVAGRVRPESSASAQPLATSVQAPKRGVGEEQVRRGLRAGTSFVLAGPWEAGTAS
jgi:hypothetical protein